jgi:hypothetical protein
MGSKFSRPDKLLPVRVICDCGAVREIEPEALAPFGG